jgi:hypothetical protein
LDYHYFNPLLARILFSHLKEYPMRKATNTVATWLGLLAGIAGLEHGYFEILQGNTRPASVVFPSWGADVCDPAKLWHACEPAMSVIPNFLVMGSLTVLLSLLVLACSIWFLRMKHGGLGLILLSIVLLLCGGGFFPPLIGLIGGAAGTQTHRPLAGQPGALTRFAARFWPWPLVLLVTWLFAQFPIGYFFNDALKSVMGWVLLFIITFLPLSVYNGYARDAVSE